VGAGTRQARAPVHVVDESFRAGDGVELRLTRRETGARAIVLVVPGILAHRDLPEHVLLAERLSQACDVATLDVRGHGESQGAFTWGAREPDDVARLARSLRERYARVLGLGFSFGGFHCAVAAGLEAGAGRPPLFDALAIVGTPAHLWLVDHNPLTRALARHLGPALRRERRLTRLAPWPLRRPGTPQTLIGAIRDTPLLIAHGSDDWLVPLAHARRLYERANEPKELAVIERGLHAEYMLAADPEALLGPLTRFLASAA
jgi:pimeloyl-ACP methyl ester carboxylesterase